MARLALPAVLRSRLLAAAVALGFLLATTLLAAAPTFTAAVADAGLQREVAASSTRPEILVTLRRYPADLARRDAAYAEAERRLKDSLGALVGASTSQASTDRSLLSRDAAATPGPGSPLAVFQRFDEFESLVQVLTGTLPSGAPTDGLHAVVGARAAATLGLAVGQQVAVVPPGTRPDDAPLVVTIDGLVEAVDPQDPAWQRFTSWFTATSEGQGPPVVRLFLSETGFYEQLPALAPNVRVAHTRTYAVNAGELSAGAASGVRETIGRLRVEVPAAVPGSAVLTALDSTIERYEDKRLFAGLPVIALLLQVAAVVLLLLWYLGEAVSQRLASSLAMLRSRGATLPQVGGALALIAGVFALPALAIAPFLAVASVRLLGTMAIFDEATAGAGLTPSLSLSSFLAAAAGALIGALTLALPGVISLRRGREAQPAFAGRPAETPFVYRYYVDVLLLGAGLLLTWELQQGQSAVGRSIFGDRNVDPVLLFAPGLLVAGIGLVTLRVLPLTARLGARVISPLAGPGLALATVRFARTPGPLIRNGLLVLVVAALASLSATFGATIAASQDERAAYAVGADLRLQAVTGMQAADGSDGVAAVRQAAPGVPVVPVQRSGATITIGTTPRPIQVLALDSDVARNIVDLRDDFITGTPAGFWDAIRGNRTVEPGRELPAGSTAFRVYLKTDPPQPNANAWVRLSTDDGRFFNVILGTLNASDWQAFEADLLDVARTDAANVPRFRLHAIFFSNLGQLTTDSGGTIYIDSVETKGEAGDWVAIEGFEGEPQYNLLLTSTAAPDAFDTTADQRQSGTRAARLRWRVNGNASPRYVVFSNFNAPVPAAFSTGLAAELGVGVGDQVIVTLGFDSVPFRVVATYGLFPTLNPADGPTVVVELRHLGDVARLVDARDRTRPNELWVRGDALPRDRIIASLQSAGLRVARIEDLADARDRVAGDPLLAAGASGVLVIGLVVSVVVTLIGLAVGIASTLSDRRLEAAILRSLGLGGTRVAASWWLEWAATLAMGAIVGAVLGRVLGGFMLSFLAFDERGRDAVPPFRLAIEWNVLATVGGVFFVMLLCAAWAYRRGVGRLSIPSEVRIVD